MKTSYSSTNTKQNNIMIKALGGCDDLSPEGKEVLAKRVKQAKSEGKHWREMAEQATNPHIKDVYLSLAEEAESAL